MAPPPVRKPVAKDRFPTLFNALKTQTYHDPSVRAVGNSRNIRTIAWNPTGHLIATGSADRTLRIWNPDKPLFKNSTELRGHHAAIEQVAWNPVKEAELASVSLDGTVKFWDVRSKTCVSTVKLDSEGLSLSWAHDGSMVMVGTRKDETLYPISVPSFTTHPVVPQRVQTNHTIFAPSFAASNDPDGQQPHYTLLLSSGNGSARIASYVPASPALTVLHTLHSHTSSCTTLALSPNGRYLATGGSDALISLFDTTEWVCARTLDRMAGGVKNISFSWDGGYVVGGSDEGTGLEIAYAETGEYVATVQTQTPAQAVAWHPSRYWLAYGQENGQLKIVGAGGGQL